MADIYHYFPIKAPCKDVFHTISTPDGLARWWTLESSGNPVEGAEYELGFGPEYNWRAVVSRRITGQEFELKLTDAVADWQGTRVGFHLEEQDGVTQVRFHHLGWPEDNDHYRTSTYCWAMYLRLLKRFVEKGEVTPYENRLDA